MYSEDLEADALFEEPLFVIAGLHNRWSRRRKIDLSDLSGEPWTMPELDNVASALIADGFRSAGIAPPTPQVVSDSMAVRTRLVEMGRFLTFLPGSTLYFGAGRLRVKILPVAFIDEGATHRGHHPEKSDAKRDRQTVHRGITQRLLTPLKKGPGESRDNSHRNKRATLPKA